jgi:regulatory protein YycH of two-component signal transduction system YycFG
MFLTQKDKKRINENTYEEIKKYTKENDFIIKKIDKKIIIHKENIFLAKHTELRNLKIYLCNLIKDNNLKLNAFMTPDNQKIGYIITMK